MTPQVTIIIITTKIQNVKELQGKMLFENLKRY